jgi:hypothetical protein
VVESLIRSYSSCREFSSLFDKALHALSIYLQLGDNPVYESIWHERKNMKRQGAKHKQDDLDDLPISLVVYIVLGLLAIMAGAAIYIVRMVQHP